jgi:hypothetical protein
MPGRTGHNVRNSFENSRVSSPSRAFEPANGLAGGQRIGRPCRMRQGRRALGVAYTVRRPLTSPTTNRTSAMTSST